MPIACCGTTADEQVLVPEPVPAAPPAIADARPAKPVTDPGKAAEREEESGAAGSEGRASPRETSNADVATRSTQSPSAAAPKQSPAWAVQLGAFSNRAKAEQLVAELRKRRYSAFVLEYRATGQVLYRVRVGPEQDRARAEEIAARLTKDGFQPVVARHP